MSRFDEAKAIYIKSLITQTSSELQEQILKDLFKEDYNYIAGLTVFMILLWPIAYMGMIVQWITEQYNRLY